MRKAPRKVRRLPKGGGQVDLWRQLHSACSFWPAELADFAEQFGKGTFPSRGILGNVHLYVSLGMGCYIGGSVKRNFAAYRGCPKVQRSTVTPSNDPTRRPDC